MIRVNDSLLREAESLGANAIIGVDLDDTMFDKEILGVIMNGTAVYIEKLNTIKSN